MNHQGIVCKLFFVAVTLLALALFEMNKEKTNGDEGCTHAKWSTASSTLVAKPAELFDYFGRRII